MGAQATIMANKRNDIPVRIDVEAVRKARIVAAYRDMALNEYLSLIVNTQAAADLAAEQGKTAAQPGPLKPGRKPKSS